jgi:hypothetical protein
VEPLIESPDDLLRRFAGETWRPKSDDRISASKLFAVYERWCERQGLQPISQTAFGIRMQKLFGNKESKGGLNWYVGVALAPKIEADHASPRRVLGRMAEAR